MIEVVAAVVINILLSFHARGFVLVGKKIIMRMQCQSHTGATSSGRLCSPAAESDADRCTAKRDCPAPSSSAFCSTVNSTSSISVHHTGKHAEGQVLMKKALRETQTLRSWL